MNFWDEHSFWFVLGIIFMPRIMLLWFGLIRSEAVEPILGLILFPRIYLMTFVSNSYSSENTILVPLLWLVAVILDIIGFIFKVRIGWIQHKLFWEQMEEMRYRRF